MIKILHNAFDGQYAVPTCANDPPWLIVEMKLEINQWDRNTDHTIHKIWIRGENTMWFRADQCHVGRKEDVQEWIDYKYPNPK